MNETDPTPAALQSNTYPRRRARFRFAAVTGAFGALLVFSIVLARAMGTPTQVRSPLLGRLAPTFDLVGLDRGRVSSADLGGTLYVVNFWASWCVPCREEAPVLQDFAARHSDGTVELLGVLFADTLPAARAFAKEFHLTYPQLRDPTGRTAVDYGVRGVPETFVVDRRGVVMAALIGALSPGRLDEVVKIVADGQTITARNNRYRTR